uniref:Uncharacterized protein n=1 Tax=Romanomermis culicivorax TaxID=13658 RepID=A0A915IZY9_ROMCU
MSGPDGVFAFSIFSVVARFFGRSVVTTAAFEIFVIPLLERYGFSLTTTDDRFFRAGANLVGGSKCSKFKEFDNNSCDNSEFSEFGGWKFFDDEVSRPFKVSLSSILLPVSKNYTFQKMDLKV